MVHLDGAGAREAHLSPTRISGHAAPADPQRSAATRWGYPPEETGVPGHGAVARRSCRRGHPPDPEPARMAPARPCLGSPPSTTRQLIKVDTSSLFPSFGQGRRAGSVSDRRQVAGPVFLISTVPLFLAHCPQKIQGVGPKNGCLARRVGAACAIGSPARNLRRPNRLDTMKPKQEKGAVVRHGQAHV